ncbi:MAG TPA: alpha/beta hydrolase [Spirochaetota bacterium]|nr:alpha/beta hydrolase [Spirochaetota bacterium]HRZ27229.1 alpha/beta hydrolase [Spirochaetota bacterium]
METPQWLLKTLSVALDGIFKASGADIRLHGLEDVPDQPVLFVINHFTRMETVFFPYILRKKTGRYPISLAHHSFFHGKFGELMGKLGAISTNDPDRDRIFLRNLLTGEMPCVIFPEGQMLKDKKIIEKGKYMIYNSGIRRPPHTGSARLALLSQFYRERIEYFHTHGRIVELREYLSYFGIPDKDVKKVILQQTVVVPVNITYYPIRAHKNAITKIAERLLGKMSDRFEEELEVETTMIADGVDIDINFGEGIYARDYLFRYSKAAKFIPSTKRYLELKELKKDLSLKKASLKLMFSYMDGIYGMTTLNHDHIFAYFLTMDPRSRISEKELKNRAFVAIEGIKEKKMANIHSSMNKNQFHLITDDEHDKYTSFIQAALEDGLVRVEKGTIIKDRGRFDMPYQFHRIRRDNIVAVLKNEVEPLNEVMKVLHKTMMTPARRHRKIIRNRFLNLDRAMFEQDYEKYGIPGESKPREIGRPFFLKRPFSRKRGIILVHGYMAAPEEIRVIGEYLYKKGYNVYGARLRGHGTAPEDLAKREWIDWYHSVNRAYIIMENSVKEIAIAGFSTGAGIALLQAANKDGKYRGAISINAPLKLQNIASRVTSVVVLWNTFLKRINLKKGAMEFVTNTPENPGINYFRNPVRGVRELGKLMEVVEKRLADIEIPVLIIQGSNDPVVNPESGPQLFEKIGTADKEIYKIYAGRHGIVRGAESEKVAARMAEFLDYAFTKKTK